MAFDLNCSVTQRPERSSVCVLRVASAARSLAAFDLVLGK